MIRIIYLVNSLNSFENLYQEQSRFLLPFVNLDLQRFFTPLLITIFRHIYESQSLRIQLFNCLALNGNPFRRTRMGDYSFFSLWYQDYDIVM